MGTLNRFRARASIAEMRAKNALDTDVKTEWTMIAIEWHTVANQVELLSDDCDVYAFCLTSQNSEYALDQD